METGAVASGTGLASALVHGTDYEPLEVYCIKGSYTRSTEYEEHPMDA